MKSKSITQTLCSQCGLCCDGVLFADVKLQSDEDADFLKQAGLPIRRRGTLCGFSQPCPALRNDGRCEIYQHRPSMCRQFECGVLKEFLAGTVTETAALREIRKAKRLARKVVGLLECAGDRDGNRPLMKRYQKVMRQPIDLHDTGSGDQRGALMLAVQELSEILQRRFLRARPAKKTDASEF
ncbi:hypothetical protein GC207_12270 [bacterium]|nr:hypothetical protein [bacterium]